ncbi:MAG: dienelactone hydrolase family protein [Candidatus Cloacimonetes bacterium]|nr:dienelactone hydrolase family protein [Candidatus Cloacimonadota bacterium]
MKFITILLLFCITIHNQSANPVQPTLDQALLALPNTKSIANFNLTLNKLKNINPTFFTKRHKAIVYMHGCAGLGYYEKLDMRLLADQGYLVYAPDSFARPDKKISCDAKKKQGGLHREVLALRLLEAKAAIDFLHTQAFIDKDIVLAGFSEGAITTAKYPHNDIHKKLILGWTCNAGWPEYIGLEGPLDLKVQAILSDKDPWFQTPYLAGSCNKFMYNRPEARSLVIMHNKHYVGDQDIAKKAIVQFLKN